MARFAASNAARSPSSSAEPSAVLYTNMFLRPDAVAVFSKPLISAKSGAT